MANMKTKQTTVLQYLQKPVLDFTYALYQSGAVYAVLLHQGCKSTGTLGNIYQIIRTARRHQL